MTNCAFTNYDTLTCLTRVLTFSFFPIGKAVSLCLRQVIFRKVNFELEKVRLLVRVSINCYISGHSFLKGPGGQD